MFNNQAILYPSLQWTAVIRTAVRPHSAAWTRRRTPKSHGSREILGEFNHWFAERLPELYAAGYVDGADDDVRLTATLLWVGESPLQEASRVEGAPATNLCRARQVTPLR